MYIFLSRVPVAIAIFPAVAVTPPKFSVPVLGNPFFFKKSNSPNGICHMILPLLRFIAEIVPHGGLIIGIPFSSKALLNELVYFGIKLFYFRFYLFPSPIRYCYL